MDLSAPDRLRHTATDQLLATAETAIGPLGASENSLLDDLAILVLFSVFEATVRELVEAEVRVEVEGLTHPALVHAGNDVLKAIEDGSFFRVLEPYKSHATNDLIEQVNQVRKYRNWVAHGRREEKRPDAAVEPRTAYIRLQKMLSVLRTKIG